MARKSIIISQTRMSWDEVRRGLLFMDVLQVSKCWVLHCNAKLETFSCPINTSEISSRLRIRNRKVCILQWLGGTYQVTLLMAVRAALVITSALLIITKRSGYCHDCACTQTKSICCLSIISFTLKLILKISTSKISLPLSTTHCNRENDFSEIAILSI